MAGRKRSNANVTQDRAQADGIGGTDSRSPNAGKRPPRVSMSKGFNLGVGIQLEEDKYYYRWITENPNRPGRVAKAEAAYYEHCTDNEGSVISRPSGSSTMYLMRLPKEYRNEDLARKKHDVERTLQAETQLKENEYAPTKKEREGGETSMVDQSTSDNPYA